MEDVAEYTKRVLVMSDGRIIMDDTTQEVFTRYKELEKVGLRAPEIAYIMDGLRARGVQVPEGIITKDAAVSALRQVMS